MSEVSDPAVVLLEARRAELTGGVDSIGVQEARVADMQAALDAAVAGLAECEAELERIDAVIALLTPEPEPEPEPEQPEGDV